MLALGGAEPLTYRDRKREREKEKERGRQKHANEYFPNFQMPLIQVTWVFEGASIV